MVVASAAEGVKRAREKIGHFAASTFQAFGVFRFFASAQVYNSPQHCEVDLQMPSSLRHSSKTEPSLPVRSLK